MLALDLNSRFAGAGCQFSNSWFEHSRRNWDDLIPQLNPSTILEVGSYEGRATCFLIDMLAQSKQLEIHCVDTWEGGLEHQLEGRLGDVAMETVRERYVFNTNLAASNNLGNVNLLVHCGRSDVELAKMLYFGEDNYFGFIYIDGSHQAPDVLCDAVLGFRLLKPGGVMVFDDYLWSEFYGDKLDPLSCPKPAVDAFVNMYRRQIEIMEFPLYRLYVRKMIA